MGNDFSDILKSAERGDASAQNKLGESYYYGNGVGSNLNEAAKWFQKSAQGGNADAMFHLSDCYHLGDGVAKDDDKAAEWLCKAAQHGSAKAKSEIDNSNRSGEGAMQYKVKAAESYRKAVEQKSAAASAMVQAEANARVQAPASKEATIVKGQTGQDPALGTYYCKSFKSTIVFDSPTHATEIREEYKIKASREFSVTLNGSEVTLFETSNPDGTIVPAEWEKRGQTSVPSLFKGNFNGKKTVLEGIWHNTGRNFDSDRFVYKKAFKIFG